MSITVETVPQVRAASRAVYVAFILAGVATASWASRIPQVRDALGLTPSRLGLVLLAIAVGSIISLLLAGQIVAHFGSRRTVTAMAALLGVALSAVGISYELGVVPVVAALVCFGFANGAWDVAMNVQGAMVERKLGKAIMPRYHAGFSVGTVAGALAGAGAVALDISVTWHLIASAVIAAVVVMLAVRAFLPDDDPAPVGAVGDAAAVGAVGDAAVAGSASARGDWVGTDRVGTDRVATDRVAMEAASMATGGNEPGGKEPGSSGLSRTLATWREPRTLLIGLFVLAFAFTEGAGIDWISVSMIDAYGASAAVGTLAFAVFLAAMTVGRWFGPGLLDRYGRVPVVRVLAAISLVGLALFIFGPSAPVAFVGALLWGLGASLGFPVGMSAAADDPARAAPRVSVVASIGYCAFLGGPPLIGFLGDHVTVIKGLVAVGVLLGVAIALAGSVKPLAAEADTRG